MFRPPFSTFFFPLILLQKFCMVASQISGKINIGQSLTATINGPSWLSPQGSFAFGFHPFNDSGDLFLLAIWYAKIPDTIVWCANEGNPVPQGSTVKLEPVVGLNLTDPAGNQLWSTSDDLSSSGFVSYGFMNNTGNFVLTKSGTNETIWESFAHPTDTLLPTQIMKMGEVVNSRLSETNFTKGRFQMHFLDDGRLVFNTRDPATNYSYEDYYYDSGTSTTNSGNQLVYDGTGNMYILLGDGSTFNLTTSIEVPASDYYHRATLNFDGVLTLYYYPRNPTQQTDDWSITKSIPDNICGSFSGQTIDSGACGYNNICSLDENGRPRCGCPPNYSLLDPNDPYGSCKPDFHVDLCEEPRQGAAVGEYTLLPLQGTDWPQEDYAMWSPCSEEECKDFCLNDCFCAAVIYEHNGNTCWKKKLPLSNGRNDSNVTRLAWLKIGKVQNSSDPIGLSGSPGVKNKLNKVVSGLLGGSMFVNFFLISVMGVGIFLANQKKHNRQHKETDRAQNRALREYSYIHCFSYQELEEATNGFTEELGRGAFGIVYQGMIRAEGPPKMVAVKKLDRLSNGVDKEFKTEVNVIGQTHHKNLVRLIGFCKEEDQRLLVYEYMSNGTLADYLFGEMRPSWTARVQIAIGIASGLLYLHDECGTQIIHCDVKPQNILLDGYHNARISDFGLAKLMALNQSQTNTGIRGTKGYVAPEWFRNKPVTAKVDVYSFGVLLLEIICCRRNICMEIPTEEKQVLTDWAFDCYQSGTLDSLVRDDMGALNDRVRMERFVMVALWCIQEDPGLRPTMRMVTLMLEGNAEVPNPPRPSSFSIISEV